MMKLVNGSISPYSNNSGFISEGERLALLQQLSPKRKQEMIKEAKEQIASVFAARVSEIFDDPDKLKKPLNLLHMGVIISLCEEALEEGQPATAQLGLGIIDSFDEETG